MLTARGRPEDVLRGFSAGADDYLAKPFELAILIARIHGLVRRREWLRASLEPRRRAGRPDSFIFGESPSTSTGSNCASASRSFR